MSPEEREYISYRLSRAGEALEEARLMLQYGHLNASVNRLYYACFYAVSALLLAEGLSSSKHSGVVALFDREWIRTSRLPVEMGRFYHTLFEWRQRGDYHDLAAFEHSDVDARLAEADGFVAGISAETEGILRKDEAQEG